MTDIVLTLCLCWAAFWFGGKMEQAELAQDCLRNGVVKMDTVKFTCKMVEQP